MHVDLWVGRIPKQRLGTSFRKQSPSLGITSSKIFKYLLSDVAVNRLIWQLNAQFWTQIKLPVIPDGLLIKLNMTQL